MASELSRFIEDELRKKGATWEDDDVEADNPHQSLMGALRVEARVKEQESQKKVFNLKRAVCIGGGIVLVLVVWALLIASSRRGEGTIVHRDAIPGFSEVDGSPEPSSQGIDTAAGTPKGAKATPAAGTPAPGTPEASEPPAASPTTETQPPADGPAESPVPVPGPAKAQDTGAAPAGAIAPSPDTKAQGGSNSTGAALPGPPAAPANGTAAAPANGTAQSSPPAVNKPSMAPGPAGTSSANSSSSQSSSPRPATSPGSSPQPAGAPAASPGVSAPEPQEPEDDSDDGDDDSDGTGDRRRLQQEVH